MDADVTASPAAARSASDKWTPQRVLEIRRWTPTLLSFRTTRDADFRFTPGHYTRLGLGPASEIVWRPYSLASAPDADYLDFIAVLIPGGAFSEQLQRVQVGDTLRVDKASYGFLTVNQLAPGKDLWLLASGTGLGPFYSILQDATVWHSFQRLILVHSVRQAAELAWRDDISALPARFAPAPAQLCYLPIVTREPGATALTQRIPALLADGRLEQAAATALSVASSRLMVCGNPELAKELRQTLSARGYTTNRRGVPGQMAFEKYW